MNRRFRKLNLVTIILVILGAVLVVSQLERFITQGTFFGYELRSKSSKAEMQTAAESKQAAVEKNKVCQKIPINTLSKIVDGEVEVTTVFSSFTGKESEFSSCAFKVSKGKETLFNINVGQRSGDSVKDVLQKANQRGGKAVTIEDKAAVFNANNGLLTIKDGNTLTTITVTGSKKSEAEIEALTLKVAKELLNN